MSNKCNPAFKMGAELWMRFAILAGRTKVLAIHERCFQPIKFPPANVLTLVDYHSCQMLSHSLAHDARLTVMHIESFFGHSRRYMD